MGRSGQGHRRAWLADGARALCGLSLGVVLAACGAKSVLDDSPIQVDASVAATLDCGASDQYTTPGLALAVSAEVTSDSGGAVGGEWSVSQTPAGAMATLTNTSKSTAEVTPSAAGDYVLHYTAGFQGGATATCDVTVHAIVGPPVATCPGETVVAVVGEPAPIVGGGFDDDGDVDFAWTIRSAPAGATATFDPADAGATAFTTDRSGAHVLTLTVTDRDGASDSCEVSVMAVSAPVLVCPTEPVMAPTRQAKTIEVTVTDDGEITARKWSVTDRPPTSKAKPAPANRAKTVITPDKAGSYTLHFEATDDDGLTSGCDVIVIGVPTPPTVMCPESVQTKPLVKTKITAMAEDDGVMTYAWTLTGFPPGSGAVAPTPANQTVTAFTPDLAGEYMLQFAATDNDGNVATCETLVRALATEGLRVEMYWDTGLTDLDLHLLSPDATRWFSDLDCYYANCAAGFTLEWEAFGPEDNPHLDLDDTNGFGPENVNIDRPAEGTYRIGVHAFNGRRADSKVTVSIYCGAESTEPAATFGPVTLSGPRQQSLNDFWRVADVKIMAGNTCIVTSLAAGAVPNISPAFEVEITR